MLEKFEKFGLKSLAVYAGGEKQSSTYKKKDKNGKWTGEWCNDEVDLTLSYPDENGININDEVTYTGC